METKDIIAQLRTKNGMSQTELAEKVFVTRQAVSRWETGETQPNTETLKLLSKLFDVSINTLLGSPRQLICQCCGMPLDDSTTSRDTDGSFNEDYCKWCYTDGKFVYTSLDRLVDFLVEHFSSEQFPPEQARAYYGKPSNSRCSSYIRQNTSCTMSSASSGFREKLRANMHKATKKCSYSLWNTFVSPWASAFISVSENSIVIFS